MPDGLATGQLVDERYALEEPLGEDALGTAWRAHDRGLNRDVRLREVRYPDDVFAEDPGKLKQALMAARLAIRLDHPGAAHVYDAFVEGDRLMLVSELLPGRPLSLAVAKRVLTPKRAAAIGLDLLKPLAAAHARGLVHGAIDPDVVLVPDRAAAGPAHLTGFGLAPSFLDAASSAWIEAMATPACMAPEQIELKGVTGATDLWALGATLYFAVEGVHAFDSVDDVVSGEPRPTTRAGALDTVLNRLLSKEPAFRPEIGDLERQLASIAGVVLGEAGSGGAGPRRGRRRRDAEPAPEIVDGASEADGGLAEEAESGRDWDAAVGPTDTEIDVDVNVDDEEPGWTDFSPGTDFDVSDDWFPEFSGTGPAEPASPAAPRIGADRAVAPPPPGDPWAPELRPPTPVAPPAPAAAAAPSPTPAPAPSSGPAAPPPPADRWTEDEDFDEASAWVDPVGSERAWRQRPYPPPDDFGDEDEDEAAGDTEAVAEVEGGAESVDSDPGQWWRSRDADPVADPSDAEAGAADEARIAAAEEAAAVWGPDAADSDDAADIDDAGDDEGGGRRRRRQRRHAAAAASDAATADSAAADEPETGAAAVAVAEPAAAQADTEADSPSRYRSTPSWPPPQGRKSFGVLILCSMVMIVMLALLVTNGHLGRAQRQAGRLTAQNRPTLNTDANLVPKDWVSYRHPNVNLSLAYPPKWTLREEGSVVTILDAASGAELRIDYRKPRGSSDPEQMWLASERDFAAKHSGDYKRAQLSPASYLGRVAALWEYTYLDGNVAVHAVDMAFLTKDYRFTMAFRAPAANWDSMLPVFHAFLSSVRPPD